MFVVLYTNSVVKKNQSESVPNNVDNIKCSNYKISTEVIFTWQGVDVQK